MGTAQITTFYGCFRTVEIWHFDRRGTKLECLSGLADHSHYEKPALIWRGHYIGLDMTHSQMLGKFEYTLPAKF